MVFMEPHWEVWTGEVIVILLIVCECWNENNGGAVEKVGQLSK